eukprot:13490090-Alexandrium_andersonii.AAC.1
MVLAAPTPTCKDRALNDGHFPPRRNRQHCTCGLQTAMMRSSLARATVPPNKDPCTLRVPSKCARAVQDAPANRERTQQQTAPPQLRAADLLACTAQARQQLKDLMQPATS